jgi:hypothetical protein
MQHGHGSFFVSKEAASLFAESLGERITTRERQIAE